MISFFQKFRGRRTVIFIINGNEYKAEHDQSDHGGEFLPGYHSHLIAIHANQLIRR